MDNSRPLGFPTATAVVVANMIGTGVFTSLGFQAAAIPSPFCLMLLWIVGGVLALCGGLVYGELSCRMPRSGGEYTYLGQIYHPSVGFLTGWISGTVAFAAPMALAAHAFGFYIGSLFPALPPKLLSLGILLIVAAVHLISPDRGALFHDFSTLIKLVSLALLIVVGLALAPNHPGLFRPRPGDLRLAFSAPFAVSLAYVSYAYSGWNASTYIAGEVSHPTRNVPLSIITGTMIVTFLYVLLNGLFIRTVPISNLQGILQIGHLYGSSLLGRIGGETMDLIIGLGLISTLSAMLLAGSRVVKAMGEDFPRIGWLARKNTKGNPRSAILLETMIAVLFVMTATFDQVLMYIGFTLTVFTLLAVAGIFILRRRSRNGDGYRTWGYPVTPLVYLVFNLFMMFFLLVNRPFEAVAGLLTVLSGLPVYLYLTRQKRDSPPLDERVPA